MAFTYYDTKTPTPSLTLPEIVAGMSSGEKTGVLMGFVKDINPITVAKRLQLDKKAVVRLHVALEEIKIHARILMRGELVLTPEIKVPETGEITQEAVFNKPPSTANVLKGEMSEKFSEWFTVVQIGAILNTMYNYSKKNGSGDWTFYKNNVIK